MLRASRVIRRLPRKLWRSCSTCCGRTGSGYKYFQSVKSYLYRSVRNEAVQFCEHQEVKERYRASVRTESGPGYSSDPHAHLEYEELRTLIRHTLDKQPRRRQQIFRMHRMEGKKYAEIALSLSLSVKTVEAEMTKVLRTLRNEIDNYIRTQ